MEHKLLALEKIFHVRCSGRGFQKDQVNTPAIQLFKFIFMYIHVSRKQNFQDTEHNISKEVNQLF